MIIHQTGLRGERLELEKVVETGAGISSLGGSAHQSGFDHRRRRSQPTGGKVVAPGVQRCEGQGRPGQAAQRGGHRRGGDGGDEGRVGHF